MSGGTTTGEVPAAADAVPRPPSWAAVPAGGFTPGSILSNRYRIMGLLGRGGMGEVYRADDLTLGHPVALKFLPSANAVDPVSRQRFLSEVRIARQLTHPNICRVYDIANLEDRYFLSMEYIDGEDLSSLLKRIGYLPAEKALDIARQLMAGLAAAHDRGILHRDLKPANIMIDGRGQARIMDFGLAVAAADEGHSAEILGTPAYMAPEQFSGKPATTRSDIYALGLVLYEIYSGKRAFNGATVAEIRHAKELETPQAPSEVQQGIGPTVDRLIMRCLERDPRERPASVRKLAAAFPGGDPLAAALEAGETPSPELVAEFGHKDGLRPLTAVSLLAVFVLCALGMIALNPRSILMQRIPAGKSPGALIDRARDYIKKNGYSAEPGDSAFGYEYDSGLVQHIQATDKSNDRWDKLTPYDGVLFWYRQSPLPLQRTEFVSSIGFGVTSADPPLHYSGDVLVRLDIDGNLRSFAAIPAASKSEDQAPAPPDWQQLFSDAGLQMDGWTSARPLWNPPTFADMQAAWTGALPGTQESLRIEASSYAGNLVDFSIIGPWSSDSRIAPAALITQTRNMFLALTIVSVVASITAFILALRNLRLGRGDRRGAFRLALATVGLGLFSWLLNEHHVAATGEFSLFLMGLSFSALTGLFTWVLYIAAEPFARRRWPLILVSWTRVLSGNWKDPLVGRDVLIGCTVATIVSCLDRLIHVAPAWLGHAEAFPLERSVGYTFASGTSMFRLVDALGWAVGNAMTALVLLLLLRMLVRSDRLTMGLAIVVGTTVTTLNADGLAVILPLTLVRQALLVYLMMRIGLVAVVVSLFVTYLFLNFPITFDLSAWYAPIGLTILAVTLCIALYGLLVATREQPLLEIDDS